VSVDRLTRNPVKAHFLLFPSRVSILSIILFNDLSRLTVEFTFDDLSFNEQFIDSAEDVVQASMLYFSPFPQYHVSFDSLGQRFVYSSTMAVIQSLDNRVEGQSIRPNQAQKWEVREFNDG